MTQPPPPPSEEQTVIEEGPAPPPGRRVVVDEAPPARDPWPWLLAALFAALAIVFFVLWLLQRGPDTNAVPNLIGLREVQAQRDASARGFRLQTIERVSNDPAGTVLDQAPEPGAELEKGARMMAVVSSGRARVAVPKLIGLKRSAAERLVQPLGLVLQVRVVPSDKPGGLVLAQDPPEGAKVAKGATVTANVSRGPSLVEVPALQGLDVERATAELSDAGLVAQIIQVPSSEPADTVIAQDPPRGQRVKRGSKVRVNVSLGPTGGTTPTTVTVTATTSVTTTAPTP